jgi:limonene-1,2-epoxide hydrolase
MLSGGTQIGSASDYGLEGRPARYSARAWSPLVPTTTLAVVPSPVQTVQRFIAAFIEAWPTKDASGLMAFFSDDAVYHNIPLDAVQGKEAIRSTLEGFMDMGGNVEVEVANIVAADNLVVVERVDRFIQSGETSSLSIVGIFEIEGGLVKAWRDYFDLSQFRS